MSRKNARCRESFNAPFLRKKEEFALFRETACVYEAIPGDQTNEEAMFLQAMRDVTPLGDNDKQEPFTPPAGKYSSTCPCPESVQIMNALHGIINGAAHFDPAHSDEYIQWRRPDVNPSIFEKLLNGLFPVQAYTDLHHMGVCQAAAAVRSFIWNSYVKGLGCVLIVHGRGRNSPNGVPVLKSEIRSWLRGGATGKVVKAYATALAMDGGMGALYVLLEPSRKYLSIQRIQSASSGRRKRKARA